jgi:hypothetical protein
MLNQRQVIVMASRPQRMRAVKKLRQRRENSPDQHQYALQSALATVKDVAGYRWSLRYCTRRIPHARIVVLLGTSCIKATSCAACVHVLERELDIVDLHVAVTNSEKAFWTMCDVDDDDDKNNI